MFNFLNPKIDYFGLDISDVFLRLVKVKKKRKDVFLSCFGQKKLNPGIIEKGKVINEELLASSIKELLEKEVHGKIKSKHVVVALPEERSFLQIVEIPKTNDSEIKKFVDQEAEKYIPLPSSDVYLDFEIISKTNDKEKLLIAALPKKIVNPYVRSIEKAGLIPLALEIESMSITRAFIKKEEDSKPIFLLDIEETKMSFVISYKGSVIFTSSEPILLADFLEDNNIDTEKSLPSGAIKIKINYEKGDVKAENFCEVPKPFLDQIIESTKKNIAYYNSHVAERYFDKGGGDIEKIIVSGRGAGLKGLIEILQEELGVDIEKGDPFVNFSKLSKRLSQSEALGYGVAFGLALYDLV